MLIEKINKYYELTRKEGINEKEITLQRFDELFNKLNVKYLTIIDKCDNYTSNCYQLLQKFNKILSSQQFARPAGQEIEI